MIQKYITKFNVESDYDSFVESSAFTYPNVSLIETGGKIHFNPVEYQWTVSGETCDGFDKYELLQKQWRYKGSNVWHNVIPEEFALGELIEADSPDCGYTPEP
jgi:hypothetical protein